MNNFEIARVCHEANRALCATQGDTSQPSWHSAPGWQVSSAVAGVRLYSDHPDFSPADAHESWMKMKLAEG